MMKAEWIKDRPIAHRGYHDMNNLVWENSTTAFERAIQHNFAIECDLQLAADDTPMVFHDSVLNRLCGRTGAVRQLTAPELRATRIGGTEDTIPTFAETLDQICDRAGLIVELKQQAEEDTDVFAASVLSCLSGYSGRIALMSFDHALLRALIAMRAPCAVGLTAYEINEEQAKSNAEAMEMPIDFVSFRYSDLPSPLVERARGCLLPVITWTVRDREGVDISRTHADQMTFEGFDPDDLQ